MEQSVSGREDKAEEMESLDKENVEPKNIQPQTYRVSGTNPLIIGIQEKEETQVK